MITSVDINNASALEAAINENGLPEFIVSSKHQFSLIPSSGSPCSPITLGDLEGDQSYVGQGNGIIAEIIGGSGEIIPALISGALPGGMVLVSDSDPYNYLGFAGTPTALGTFTFELGGTIGGCPITPREYTVEVWQEFSAETYRVTVSGLTGLYGTDYILDHAEFSGSTAFFPSTFDLTRLVLEGGDVSTATDLWNISQMPVAEEMVNTNIYDSIFAYPSIASGSQPFTGDYKASSQVVSVFEAFNGYSQNGEWKARILNEDVEDVGEVTYFALILKPI